MAAPPYWHTWCMLYCHNASQHPSSGAPQLQHHQLSAAAAYTSRQVHSSSSNKGSRLKRSASSCSPVLQGQQAAAKHTLSSRGLTGTHWVSLLPLTRLQQQMMLETCRPPQHILQVQQQLLLAVAAAVNRAAQLASHKRQA